MATALVYGAPLSLSHDRAVSWKALDKQSAHIDWCAVDWTDPDLKFVLALKHEADGLLLRSADSGQSFAEVGKGFGTGWIFDNQTAVVAQAKSRETPTPQLQRTTDGGKTFQPSGEFSPVGMNSAQALPKWNAGTLYWLVDGGLIATTDLGQTWQTLSNPKEAQYGPIFGKNERHLLVLTKTGPIESTDGGLNWSPPLPLPKELKGLGGLSWLEYDPPHDTFYLMKMGSDLYRYSRKD